MAQGQASILVVEDDEATRAFLCEQLAADGYRVAGATGVAEALRALEVRRPDVVLLDLTLADGHGLMVLDRVRAADGAASRIDPDTPVVVLSGRAGEADRIRGLTRGADDYVCKPFSYPELLGAVVPYLWFLSTCKEGDSKPPNPVPGPSERTEKCEKSGTHPPGAGAAGCGRRPSAPRGQGGERARRGSA